MTLIFITFSLILIAVCFSILFPYKKKHENNKPQNDKFPYTKKQFFSKNEQLFYSALTSAVGSHFLIFPKVRLWDVIDTKTDMPKNERYKYQNKIKQKHIDFILLTPNDHSVTIAIELDDSSHNKPQTIENDLFKNFALANAGIPILRIKTSKQYNMEYIKQQILETIRQLQKITPPPQK